MLVSRKAALAATLFLIGVGAVAARPLMPYEYRFWPSNGQNLAPCNEAWVQDAIRSAFNTHEESYWHSPLLMQDFLRIRQIGFRTNGPDFDPRRYCVARVMFNDGRARVVKYNLVDGGGFAGIGDGVKWCVVGLDRNHVYSPDCVAAGP